jgi:myo-inositol-1(or 4)-monophosphatase
MQGKGLAGGLISTGVPFGGKNLLTLDSFQSTVKDVLACQTSGIRRLGSAALDLAYVAAGRYDGFWESNLNIWDIAAGVLLVKEAGGIVSDFGNEEGFLQSGNIVAAPKGAFSELVEITQRNYLP